MAELSTLEFDIVVRRASVANTSVPSQVCALYFMRFKGNFREILASGQLLGIQKVL